MNQREEENGNLYSEIREHRLHFIGDPLGNFWARISHELKVDDGLNPATVRYSIEGGLASGQVGEAVQPRIVQRVVQRYAESAEIEDLTPHVLRHTFARSLLDSGATPFEVAKLLGHSSLDSTARYTQPSEEELRNAVERLGEG